MSTQNLKCIGYTPALEDGSIEIKTLRQRSFPRTKPITVYKTANVAQSYSSDGLCKAVFIKED